MKKLTTPTIIAILFWIVLIALIVYAFHIYAPDPTPDYGDLGEHRPDGLDCVYITKVIDGDTFVTKDGTTARLRNIDAPEHYTDAGKVATRVARDLLLDKCLTVTTDGRRGKYGRLLVDVRLPDGTFFSNYMVNNGYAREWK